MSGSGSLHSFGTILSGLSKRLGLESRLLELRFQHRWREIIGEPIASHTWPAQIRFNKLYLTVQNSVWLQQLTFLKPTLLAKVNAEAGTDCVTEIVLRVGELPSQAVDSGSTVLADSTGTLSEAELAEVLTHTAAIQDPDIRAKFKEVISSYPAQAPARPAKNPSRAL
jgi:hypothetical protein